MTALDRAKLELYRRLLNTSIEAMSDSDIDLLDILAADPCVRAVLDKAAKPQSSEDSLK